jgi:nuclear transport factor 2 (NTF2) superfamily protein
MSSATDPTGSESPLVDPIRFLREAEAAWQQGDPDAAVAAYTDDAIIFYGEELSRTGEEVREWARRWFGHVDDFEITKTFRAFSDGCLASEWRSEYTDPATGKRMIERGAEFFFFRGNKVYRHHMFEHSWPVGEAAPPAWLQEAPTDASSEAGA